MIDYSQSYSATWRVYKVNHDTWADAGQVENVDEISITRTADGDLIESGSMEITGDFDADYYRIVMTAEQGGEVERVDVATMLFVSTDGEYNYGTMTQSVDGYSVLFPASTTAVLTGEYAPAGIDGAKYAGDLLRSAINAPVSVEGAFTLNDNVVHEIGSSILEAVWAVLDAGGFCIQIDGRGVVHIRKIPTEPSLTIDSTTAKMLSNGIKYTTDISEIPNRYIVIVGYSRTIAENNDPDSIVSTVSRGYYVDEVDESPTPVNGETIGKYAERKLREMSKLEDERVYTREYAPDVYPYSVVKASIDGLEGNLRVVEQSIECGYGIVVEETANSEVYLWQ